MSAEPIMEPVMTQVDPIDLLIAFEEASPMPIRAEYIEETGIVPPQPDEEHSDGIAQLFLQFNDAGFRFAGFGMGFRAAHEDSRTAALVIPDFYVRRRKATELDEAYSKTHKGWYPIDMLAVVGEVTSTNHEVDTGPKLRIYAGAGVPVYVLIHRKEKVAYCFSDPAATEDTTVPATTGDATVKHRYRREVKVDLGLPLPLPAPYPALDTTAFLTD
ncbi:Uma2 family endonuclease [Streptomyces sp. NPDC056161]|uniref:Uma2 family endonuclease n=1 Tax=Streptomyces sp. NPDC056161 TaxID=3345732 RepID=UPI0035DCB04A